MGRRDPSSGGRRRSSRPSPSLSPSPSPRERGPGPARRVRRGLTLLELVLAFAMLVLLLAILIPSMQRARVTAWRDESQSNLRVLHQSWDTWLQEQEGRFPFVPNQPGWLWGGVRHSSVTGRPFLDTERPISRMFEPAPEVVELFRSPADAGITGPTGGVGTGDRTCFEAFGTSYRANPYLLDARLNVAPGRVVEGDLVRGLTIAEIETAPSRLMILGEPLWAEVLRGTGLDAAWYDDPDHTNLLFLDGHVSYQRIDAAGGPGAPVFEPSVRWTVRPGPSEGVERPASAGVR